jgi:hypothetical protein
MAKQVKLDLSQFKASGVYTLEFDASENIIINPQTIRLVVGYSNIGPFNAPVYCPDVSTFQTVFGGIDKTLEKKGSFFHRSALTCLQSGPIFAINLRKLNNSVNENGDPDYAQGSDVSRYRAFSTATEEHNGNNATGGYSDPYTNQDKLLASYYNKEKFWFPDTINFLATRDGIATVQSDKSKLFNLVNLGQNPVSIIVRKSLDSSFPIKGFDITAKEYFGADNVPSYVHPYDYISDWFIDVIVISGNWADYQSLANDPVYSPYFTSKGFIKSQIDNFLALNTVNIVTTVTGALIPNFTDQNGSLRYIQTLINNQTTSTGIFCAINEEALDDIQTNPSVIDLVGHDLINKVGPEAVTNTTTSLDFLSYDQQLLADFTYARNVDGATAGTELEYVGSPSIGIPILIETGELVKDTAFQATDSGILTSDFKLYDVTLRDGGYVYLQTEFINPTTHDTQLATLEGSVSQSVSAPAERWVLGKVTANIPSGGYLGFYQGDLVKLKITEAKYVTNSTLAPGIQQQLRLKLSHPLIGQTTSTVYVEPLDDTNKSTANAYQIGNPNYFDRDIASPSPDILGGIESFLAYENSLAYRDWVKGNITDGDVIWVSDDGALEQFVKFEKTIDRDGYSVLVIKAYTTSAFTTQDNIANWDTSYISSQPIGSNLSIGETINIVSTAGNINDFVEITSQLLPNVVEIPTLDPATFTALKVGDLLVSTDVSIYDGVQLRLTRVLEVKSVAGGSPGVYTIQVKTERPIKLYPGITTRVLKFKSIQEFVTSFNFTYLPGSDIKAASKPDGTDTRMNELLDVLYTTNLARALADTEVITFRYVIDTFDGGVQPNCKYQLTKLAKMRQKCMAICNAPSIKKFSESVDPRFTSAPTPTEPAPLLEARYIADGGNLSLNPSFTFSLPDEDLGAKFSGFFSPFLTVRDNGKNINVPPAAYVSNNFIRKFITGEPYSIVAGVKRGIISAGNLVGLEYDFDILDREYIEPFGINPIIRKRGIGVVIYGNQTSYQRTNTAFNNLHVRDLLITVESGIEDILSNYVFDFNEDNVRLEIKTLVDNYLTGVRAVGGIYNYLSIMDSSNNTPAIIDQNLGIIDVIIEPARGIHKFVNRMTVTRTGGISSGGFIQFS